ncbi:hypothetical protein bthur0013_29230 [Bacillus thuringiensis IBL 200]|nr:hypothetical protein CT43_CH2998 [Bacillus thuringiensis serovar chinensis CT-43]AGG01762.1 hypothetical protein H175_ch3049 [Bacillus thuringiensis serovar thuringiensis str. IS5056]EEM28388.1 hypothetical protein bthur0002_27830 [Bacillus thuringiensis Bt407]EEM65617.1 hypothetical protein bthur0008_27740 [Bacillus thuringiensis serovar berliner ATCC 10792]EEM95700.1 hypothetical protein bthur0013_29230 [Bacillus thuringiensis IBL 200]
MEYGDKEGIQTFRDMELGKRRSFFKKNASKRMGFTKV